MFYIVNVLMLNALNYRISRLYSYLGQIIKRQCFLCQRASHACCWCELLRVIHTVLRKQAVSNECLIKTAILFTMLFGFIYYTFVCVLMCFKFVFSTNDNICYNGWALKAKITRVRMCTSLFRTTEKALEALLRWSIYVEIDTYFTIG